MDNLTKEFKEQVREADMIIKILLKRNEFEKRDLLGLQQLLEAIAKGRI